jgi:hypothetical protein
VLRFQAEAGNLPIVEWVDPVEVAFTHPAHEPVGIKGRYVGAPAGEMIMAEPLANSTCFQSVRQGFRAALPLTSIRARIMRGFIMKLDKENRDKFIY